MALGVNIQWGYAGLFNVGIMGFAALGGVAAVLVSMPPVAGRAGRRRLEPRPRRRSPSSAPSAAALFVLRARAGRACAARSALLTVVVGYFVMRLFLDPAVAGDRGGRTRPPPAISAASACRSLLVLAGRRPLRRRRRLARRQDRARPALGLSRHRHARHRRDHPRDPEERELADPRRQERHRPAAAAARRARAAGTRRGSRDLAGALRRRRRSPPPRSSSRLGYARAVRRRARRRCSGSPSGAELALGPDDARDPRQPRRGRGDGQGRHRAATCRSSCSARRSSASPARCW